MQRYYFDFRDGDRLHRDDAGEDISPERLRAMATKSLVELARDRLVDAGESRHLAIEVRDDNGPVMRVSLDFDFDGVLSQGGKAAPVVRQAGRQEALIVEGRWPRGRLLHR
jgi:hypothetical protein